MKNQTITKLIRSGKKTRMPGAVMPMLCSLVKEPFDNDDWLFEIKWDGYRLISHVDKQGVRMASRSGLDYTNRYPLLSKELKKIGVSMVVDGEAVVFNESGKPDFDALQLYNGNISPIVYCVFDLIWIDGYDVTGLPLVTRKTILQHVLARNEAIRFSEHFETGIDLYERIVKENLEGIVVKKKQSSYQPGQRGTDWLKIPTRIRQEFVIGGWAESEKGRAFRSLLFGAYNGSKLEWIGRSGGGYKDREMPAILASLHQLETSVSPFTNKVLDTKGAVIHWVKPRLVANFEFATWTKSGRIRKPATFLGFRADKNPGDVVREMPADRPVKTSKTSAVLKPVKLPARKYLNKESNWRKIDATNAGETDRLDVGDHVVEVTDVDRELWKGITKAELLGYYHTVAKIILPHLEDRPQSLHLKVNGAMAPGFYIKDMENRQPGYADVFVDKRKHRSPGKRNKIDYLVCNNEATLLYMVNLGCIDIHPWTSRITSIDTPDYINVDLDPSDDDFRKVIDAALIARDVFAQLKLTAFIKTSGKTGLHLLIPCSGFSFPQARKLSMALGALIHKQAPKFTTLEIDISRRGDKLLLDYSQYDYADTLAAPYCVRPARSPVVSAPLEWKEVKPTLNPLDFTIHTIGKRVSRKGDLWSNINDPAIVAANTKKLLILKDH